MVQKHFWYVSFKRSAEIITGASNNRDEITVQSRVHYTNNGNKNSCLREHRTSSFRPFSDSYTKDKYLYGGLFLVVYFKKTATD